MCPFAFGACNDAPEVFDGSFFEGARICVYSGESNVTIRVPPSDAAGIRGFALGKDA